MTVLAAGLNAHGQFSDEKDIGGFAQLTDEEASVLLSTWSTLTVTTSDKVVTSGQETWTKRLEAGTALDSALGDHNGMLAALDQLGQLHVVTVDGLEPCGEPDNTPSLSKAAIASNGRVVVTHVQASGGNLIHIGEFVSFDQFRNWYEDPSEPKNYPSAHHMVMGRPKQLLAGSGTFALLTQDGRVLTWGDTRYRSLARSVVGKNTAVAEVPGLVDALGGLPVEKVALGGWLGAAVADGALYIWGSCMPGKDQNLTSLETVQPGEHLALVQLQDEDGHDLDVVDVAIGDGHIVLVTADGIAFGMGENQYGQLGTGSDTADFIPEWRQISVTGTVKNVVCGPKSTFLMVGS